MIVKVLTRQNKNRMLDEFDGFVPDRPTVMRETHPEGREATLVVSSTLSPLSVRSACILTIREIEREQYGKPLSDLTWPEKVG